MQVKISKARQRMIEVMTIKGLSPKTQSNYQATVSALSRHYGRPPHRLSAEEVRSWLLARIERGLAVRTTNGNVAALRLFYTDVVGQAGKVAGLHYRRVQDSLPHSIPEADVHRLIGGIRDLRYRTAALTAHGAGLRISEVVALKISDIDGEKGLLRIGSGKGGHERMAHLPAPVLEALRRYWRSTEPRPTSWLFCHKQADQPITAASLRAAFNRSRDQAGLDRNVTFHCLRHAVATHLHERGASISVVQDVHGHKSPEATRIYARTTGSMYRKIDHPVAGFARTV